MFNFHHLDTDVRVLMLEAINESHAKDKLYHSSYFKIEPNPTYLDLLIQAAKDHNEVWLQNELTRNNLFKSHTLVTKANGNTHERAVPSTAAQTFADGQFNRHYMQGLCKYARSKGQRLLTVYRAHPRYHPRDESLLLEGTQIDVDELDLQLQDPDCYLTCSVLQPNSGLSVRM